MNFPDEMKFPVQESKPQDIHFNPTFSPVFSPNLPPINPTVEVRVEPTPYNIVLPDLPIVVELPEMKWAITQTLEIQWKYLGAILFANSAFVVILLFALNYYFYEFEWPSSPTISN